MENEQNSLTPPDHGSPTAPSENSASVASGDAAQEPTAEATEAYYEPDPARSSGRLWQVLTVMLLIVVLGVGGAGFYFYTQMRSKQQGIDASLGRETAQTSELQRQISSLQSDLSSVHRELAAVQTQLSHGDQQVEQRLVEHNKHFTGQIEQLRVELNRSVEVLQRQLGKTRGDLMIADAEYLIGAALQKLHLLGDPKPVVAALEAADQRLLESGDPAVFKVREELAREIAVLRNLKAPDLVGTSSKILALAEKISLLPLDLPHAGKLPSEPAPEPPKTEVKDIDDLFGQAWEDFKGIVTVRHSNRPIPAILTPEEAVATRDVLYLKLEMARISLLREDQKLYKDNLQYALSWLTQHFDTDAPPTKAFADQLAALANEPVQLEFPDIGKSLKLLRDITKLRLEVTPPAGGSQPPVTPNAGG